MPMKFSRLNSLAIIVAILSILIFLLLSIGNKCTLPVKTGQNWLLLIAHPDDESMFFAPSLFNLALYGINLYLISITSGNSEGLGHVRAKELFAAAEIYGIPKSQVHFLDPEERFFPDGFHGWNITNLSMALFPMISKIQPHGIITFDKWGISGHPNHEAAFHSLEMLKDGGNFTSIPQLFALETVPLWRKYSTFLDVFYTQLDCLFTGHTREHFHMIWTQPFGVYHAMAQHRSQLIWFRYLYMAFSRYVYVNTFVSII